jgi:hypothetical protein
MKKVLIALVLVAVFAFAGSASALVLEPATTTSITSDPGGGRP